jgi:CheY-like chemotaxis protein
MKLEFESNTATVSYPAADQSAVEAYPPTVEKNVLQLFQTGVKAAQNGNRAEARQMLLQVVEAEPGNENAWLWLASISEYPEELLGFLNNILNINPNNARALEWSRGTKSLLAKNFVQRGVDASGEAQMDLARQCFLQAVAHDERNEMAWFRLASISDSADEKISHLQKVLDLNPENETAKASLQTAKSNVTDSLLRKANVAAISGERETASEMLQEVLKQAPDLEEAWILKSYLAESFSEKITCFEKVLTLNPENDAAISGLASLREMMVRAENKKAQQLAVVAYLSDAIDGRQNEAKADLTSDVIMTQNSEEEEEEVEYTVETSQIIDEDAVSEVSEDQTTQEFEYTPVEIQSANEYFQAQNEVSEVTYSMDSVEELAEDSNETTLPTDDDYSVQEDTDYSVQPSYAAANDDSAATLYQTPETDFAPTDSSEQSENHNEVFAASPDSETVENTAFKPAAGTHSCPFCAVENEPNAFACASCKTVLTLSNLEMLLGNTEADAEIVRQAVERMEEAQTVRDLEIDELKKLAVGHINLKNLREGILHLQAALRMNPNDVVLGSQINTLKIRLMEIEQQEDAQSSMTRGKKIMVVDDSATVRKLISGKLEKSGHDVVCAVDGIDALDKIKEFIPDLILLDIMMPQMDGYQVCKFLRGNEATKNVPIVMISGKDGFFDKVRGRMSGTTGYITKPFGPEALMKTVESYIV